MQVLEAQTQAPSSSNKVSRIATYVATGALALAGIIYVGFVMLFPFYCDFDCFYGFMMIGGFYCGIAVGIIFAIYVTVLLISLCINRCSQKPQFIVVDHAAYNNFQQPTPIQQPTPFQPFSSSNPRDFVPPSRFSTAARIVMYIYLGVLGLIGLVFFGWMVYAVFACGFDFGCIWYSAFVVYFYIFGIAISTATAIFTPLASFLFLVSACARRPQIIYVKQSEYDQTYGVQQNLQPLGGQTYGATPVSGKEYVVV